MPRHYPQISALPANVEKSYTVNGFINLVYNLLQTIGLPLPQLSLKESICVYQPRTYLGSLLSHTE